MGLPWRDEAQASAVPENAHLVVQKLAENLFSSDRFNFYNKKKPSPQELGVEPSCSFTSRGTS